MVINYVVADFRSNNNLLNYSFNLFIVVCEVLLLRCFSYIPKHAHKIVGIKMRKHRKKKFTSMFGSLSLLSFINETTDKCFNIVNPNKHCKNNSD